MSRAAALLLLATLCLLPGTLCAHGGQYLGPTTGPVPTPPGPTGPRGATATPRMVPGGPLTGGNANLDVSSWRVWWELNHDRYVTRPGTPEVEDAVRESTVVASLLQALERTDDPGLNAAALIALGKVGVDDPKVLAAIRAGLTASHIEVREAAVLALGLSDIPEVLRDLAALVQDSADGRRLTHRENVGDRVRTFAAYALGLFASRSDDAGSKDAVLDILVGVLEDRRTKDPDLLTGVLNGIRMIDPAVAQGGAHKRVLWKAVAVLEKFLDRRFQDQTAGVQSHALTALASLVGRGDGAEQQRAKALVTTWLERPRADPMAHVSATIALGKLLQPGDADQLKILARRIARPPEPMVRNLGMVALGEIGGPVAFEQLRKALGESDREVQAWAALGLGLLAFHHQIGAAENAQQDPAVDLRSEAGDLLAAGLRDNRDKDVLAAIAIGLGLAGHEDAAPELRKLLDKYLKLGEFSGLVCVGLAMLDDRSSIPTMRTAMSLADQPILFGHAALALASLDLVDSSAVAVGALRSSVGDALSQMPRLAAAAKAIGEFRDPADVDELARLVREVDRDRRASQRTLRSAFAAAALGAVVDRDRLGFGARVANGMNYTGGVQTISNGNNGILDIF